MNDQAHKLRLLLQQENKVKARNLAVVSGKGGVGKSNISINTALNLHKKGYKVLLFDLDIGMGNVNIILGSPTSRTIEDFLEKNISITEIISETPEGISYISAGNGLNKTVELSNDKITRLINGLDELQYSYDFIIFDMAAGATAGSIKILLAVDEIVVVTTPEPTAITDAYSMMKFIVLEGATSEFFIICNRAESDKQGRETLERLRQTAIKFLRKEVQILGVLPEDQHVRKAVINQIPFSHKYPKSPISIRLENLVNQYLDFGTHSEKKEVNNHSFISKLRRLFFMKERSRVD